MSDQDKKKIINRLRTIKGHLTAVENMINDEKDCEEILFQIFAIKSSMDKLGQVFLENYTTDCLFKRIKNGDISDESLKEIINAIIKYS